MTRSMVIVDIPFGSVHAYRVGHLIEDEAVTANGWEAYVEASARSPRPEAASPTSKNTKPEKNETAAAAGGKDKASA